MIKDRPVLFSAPMVRALLDCTKSQTRRIAKGLPSSCVSLGEHHEIKGAFWQLNADGQPFNDLLLCPHGKSGDRLYVREAFSYLHGYHVKDVGLPIWYWADGNPQHGDWTRPKPSIHMPRWASRTTLEITAVRVERLNDISEADAIAEGTPWDDRASTVREAYALLWESLNGPGSWEINPFVWVIEFKRMTT